jgi:uncharacterized membrane protein YhaH (DUF805 family)
VKNKHNIPELGELNIEPVTATPVVATPVVARKVPPFIPPVKKSNATPDLFSPSLKGRLGRLSFINFGMIYLGLVMCALNGPLTFLEIFEAEGSAFEAFLLLIALLALVALVAGFFRLCVLRLHDMDIHGGYSALPIALLIFGGSITVLPIDDNTGNDFGALEVFILLWLMGSLALFVASVWLMARPGTTGTNTYGEQPEKGRIIGLIAMILSVIIFVAVIVLLATVAAEYTNIL